MIAVLAWIAGVMAISTLVSILGGKALRRGNKIMGEQEKRIQRDNELIATFIMLEDELGRTPTTNEVWEAAPPWFDTQEAI